MSGRRAYALIPRTCLPLLVFVKGVCESLLPVVIPPCAANRNRRGRAIMIAMIALVLDSVADERDAIAN